MFSATISGFFGVIMIPWYYIVAAMHSNVESNSGNDELFDTEIALSVTIDNISRSFCGLDWNTGDSTFR